LRRVHRAFFTGQPMLDATWFRQNHGELYRKSRADGLAEEQARQYDARENDRSVAEERDDIVPPHCVANRTRSITRGSLPIRPTNRLQDSSQCRDRANEQQHRQNSHQKESCFHVVHHRDHTASLLLLDSPTPPTEPGTYLGSCLSLLNAFV